MDAELALSNLSVCNRVFAKSKGCVITVAVDAASVAHAELIVGDVSPPPADAAAALARRRKS